uniref:Bacterial Pleckstrin homology domain-containing protein n=1 Tax=Paramoeba aestuarina TaxID=180227 RepID=A0A7S4KX97_9EUKA
MAAVIAYISDDLAVSSVEEGEQRMQEISKYLLVDGEKVLLAFRGRGGNGRDYTYFTSRRILVQDVKGLTGKRINWRSIPYDSIWAYEIQTAGSIDCDTELTLYIGGLGSIEFSFMKSTVDLFQIAQFMNLKLLRNRDIAPERDSALPGEKGSGKFTNFLNWMLNDHSEVCAKNVQEQLTNNPSLLVPGEHVEMAFKCGRDSLVCTNSRLMYIDVKGITGKKISYLSLPWEQVRAFSVETASTHFWSRDGEATIWTRVPELKKLHFDLYKGNCDFFHLQKIFCSHILGTGSVEAYGGPSAAPANPSSSSTAGNWLAWLGDDHQVIDHNMVNEQFHTEFPVLAATEVAEMAFQGRRDMLIFTTKRMLVVDRKGWSGKKTNYLSFPWHTIQAFAVRSAGSLDNDSEVCFWTDIMHDPPPPSTEDNPNPPPEPGMSYFEQNLRASKVNLAGVQAYLAYRCLSNDPFVTPDVVVDPAYLQKAANSTSTISKVYDFLGDNARSVDPAQVTNDLQERGMLVPGESVVGAYKSGRDTLCLTTRRILINDVQGLSGKRVEVRTIPYSSVRSFEIQTAGAFDRDCEMVFQINNPWTLRAVQQDLRKSMVDVFYIQGLIAAQVLRRRNEPELVDSAYPPPGHKPDSDFKAFLKWLGNNAVEVSQEECNEKFHTNPPVLLKDEIVELAFKVGRDLILYTSRRCLRVNVRGFTGKSIAYTSVPNRVFTAYEVQSAGSIDNDCETKMWVDLPRYGHPAPRIHLSQDISKKKGDIYQIQHHYTTKLT